jgi:hypothetical protein
MVGHDDAFNWLVCQQFPERCPISGQIAGGSVMAYLPIQRAIPLFLVD